MPILVDIATLPKLVHSGGISEEVSRRRRARTGRKKLGFSGVVLRRCRAEGTLGQAPKSLVLVLVSLVLVLVPLVLVLGSLVLEFLSLVLVLVSLVLVLVPLVLVLVSLVPYPYFPYRPL